MVLGNHSLGLLLILAVSSNLLASSLPCSCKGCKESQFNLHTAIRASCR